MQVLCAWEERHQLLREWVGTLKGYPHAISGMIPAVPAISGSSRPFGGELGTGSTVPGTNGPLSKYEKALVTIEFGQAQVGTLNVRYTQPGQSIGWREIAYAFTEDFEPISEFMTVPAEGFQWSDGQKLKPEEAPGKQIIGFNYTLTRNYLFGDNITELLGLVDKVNDRSLIGKTPLLNGMYFPPETLLFTVPTVHTRAISMYSTEFLEFTMHLHYREAGWNKFWRPDKKVYGSPSELPLQIIAVGDWDMIYTTPESEEEEPVPYKNFKLANFLVL